MASKPPAFQWYPKDCDTDEDVRAMDDREFGFYMRCLNHSWLNGGLPNSLPEIARIMGRTPNYVKKIWERVGKKFAEREGRLVNPKQETQRTTARDFVDSRTCAANTRWNRVREQVEIDARALDVHCPPLKENAEAEAEVVEVEVISDVVIFEEPPPLVAPLPPPVDKPSWEELNAGWKWLESEYPGTVNVHMDRRLFLSVMETRKDLTDLRSNLPLWKATRKWREGFFNELKNFLGERIFSVIPKLEREATAKASAASQLSPAMQRLSDEVNKPCKT